VNTIFFTAIAALAVAANAQPTVAQDRSADDIPVQIASCSVVPAYAVAPSGDDNVPVNDGVVRPQR
jgi:hypothetical protein